MSWILRIPRKLRGKVQGKSLEPLGKLSFFPGRPFGVLSLFAKNDTKWKVRTRSWTILEMISMRGWSTTYPFSEMNHITCWHVCPESASEVSKVWNKQRRLVGTGVCFRCLLDMLDKHLFFIIVTQLQQPRKFLTDLNHSFLLCSEYLWMEIWRHFDCM